jgi:hypothetical protein
LQQRYGGALSVGCRTWGRHTVFVVVGGGGSSRPWGTGRQGALQLRVGVLQLCGALLSGAESGLQLADARSLLRLGSLGGHPLAYRATDTAPR